MKPILASTVSIDIPFKGIILIIFFFFSERQAPCPGPGAQPARATRRGKRETPTINRFKVFSFFSSDH
jgi:hypothetical protein